MSSTAVCSVSSSTLPRSRFGRPLMAFVVSAHKKRTKHLTMVPCHCRCIDPCHKFWPNTKILRKPPAARVCVRTMSTMDRSHKKRISLQFCVCVCVSLIAFCPCASSMPCPLTDAALIHSTFPSKIYRLKRKRMNIYML